MGRPKKVVMEQLAVFQFPYSKPKKGWTDKKVKAFVRLANKRTGLKAIARHIKMSDTACKQMWLELRRAFQQKYTLDRYLQEGRPLRTGKKVLAK